MTKDTQYLKQREAWHKKRKAIASKNTRLINYWRSFPWWQFWKRPPDFEQQRAIILTNWGRWSSTKILMKNICPIYRFTYHHPLPFSARQLLRYVVPRLRPQKNIGLTAKQSPKIFPNNLQRILLITAESRE